MSEEEFTTIFDEGYTEGYGAGMVLGLGLGILAAGALVLLYLVVLK